MTADEDRRAIESLHSRFAHAVDRPDYELLRSLYTDDAIEEHGPYNGPVDGYIAWLREFAPSFEIMHHVFSHILLAVDGTTAESETRGTAYLRLRADSPCNMMVVTRHFDRYRRVDGSWRFAHRALCIDWAQDFGPPDKSRDTVRVFPAGVVGPDDLVYRKVPKAMVALRPRSGSAA